MLTLEELERKAYISGDTMLADLCARIEQFEQDEFEVIELREEIAELQHELQVQSDLEDDVEYWRERAIEAEAKLETIEWLETKEKED